LIGNTIIYENKPNCYDEAIDHYRKSIEILERNLERHYKDKGQTMQKFEVDKYGLKKKLATVLIFDDDKAREMKGVLELIYEKVEGAFEEKEVNKDYKAELNKMQEQQQNIKSGNVFAKSQLPQVEGETNKVKFLGTFGKKKITEEVNSDKENAQKEETLVTKKDTNGVNDAEQGSKKLKQD